MSFEKQRLAISTACLPDIRTTAIAETPCGVAGATMVSSRDCMNFLLALLEQCYYSCVLSQNKSFKHIDMKIILLVVVLAAVAVFATASYVKKKNAEAVAEVSKNFYSFNIPALDGDSSINMADYKGKYVLLVNVASKCGYTPQYEGLQKLYETHQDKLVIIGFPCNQFMGQEPGGSEDIREFCSLTYGVSFPMTEKVKVKGPDKHPIYHWLTTKTLNGVDDYSVTWNFNKFLIGPDGKLKAYFGSKTEPMSEEITSLIE